MKVELENKNNLDNDRAKRLKAYATAFNNKKEKDRQAERLSEYADKINEKENK